MRIETDAAGGKVVLSRRNLLTLLAKLDGHPPDSMMQIRAPAMYGRWLIEAEEDGPHYDHPSRLEVVGIAGRMHPETEAVLVADRPGFPLDTVLDPRD